MMRNSPALPEQWDEVADVVVVGSGAAGLTTAVIAAAEGASVIVLEKTEFIGGTTAVSGGGFWIPNNHHMPEVGVSDDREDALAYVRACAGDGADDTILVALVDHGPAMLRHLEQRVGLPPFRAWPPVGASVDYRPWLRGARHGGRTLESARFPLPSLGEWASRVRTGPQSRAIGDRMNFFFKHVHAAPPRPLASARAASDREIVDVQAGTALVAQLLKACLAHGVRIETRAPVTELLVHDEAVIGVRAAADDHVRSVRATRGVVLASGGYGANEQLRRLWLRRPVVETCEIDENQGDGHMLGIAIGAEMANIGDAWWMPRTPVGAEDDGTLSIGGTRDDRSLPHTVIVNGEGQRFVNESRNYYDFCAAFGTTHAPANQPAWLIFDDQGVQKYAALAAKVAEASSPSWMLTADSLDTLAAQIHVPPDSLIETVQRFNAHARAGEDPDFGRGSDAWDISFGDPRHGPNPALGTLERPPFRAVSILPGALATKGGLRVNDRGEVLRADTGEAIPGLSAAGNCSSGAIPNAYAGAGATIGAAMTFAYLIAMRLAGSGVRRDTPLDAYA